MGKSKPQVQMPSMVEVARATDVAMVQARESLVLVRSIVVEDSETYGMGARACAEVKAEWERVDAQRRRWVDPLNGVVKDINATAKPVLAALEEAEADLKAKLAAWISAAEAERQRLLDQVQADPRRAASLIEAADALVVPAVAGLTSRVEWVGEVVDAAAIPAAFRVPDPKALLAITKATAGDPKIPGWRAFPRTTIAVSAKKLAE